MRIQALSEILDGWPTQFGDTLAELADMPNDQFKAEVDKLDKATANVVWVFRKQVLDIARRNEREIALAGYPFTDAALRNGAVSPKNGRWTIYAIDDQHRRVPSPKRQGKSRFQLDITNKFPTPDEAPPTITGGSFLVIWGGSPDVFEIPGVAERILTFAKTHTLLDVSCWDGDTGDHWSLRHAALTKGDGKEENVNYGPLAEKARQAWA
jgi:hypothetical protein